MGIFKIECGASCHIKANSKEQSLSTKCVREYFPEEELSELEIEEVAQDEWLTINFEGTKITHTAKEWDCIYEGFSPLMLSQSDY